MSPSGMKQTSWLSGLRATASPRSSASSRTESLVESPRGNSARKPDSHDVCFIPDGDTAGFLRRKIGDAPGTIVDADGAVLGSHDGAFAYTVGQRKGLRLGIPAADGRPRYVLDVSPVDRTVTVGPREALAVGRAEGIRPRWCGSPPVGRCAAPRRSGRTAPPYPRPRCSTAIGCT